MSTRAQLLAEVASQFADNTSGAITPAILRTVTSDFINSALITATDQATLAQMQAGTSQTTFVTPYSLSSSPNTFTALQTFNANISFPATTSSQSAGVIFQKGTDGTSVPIFHTFQHAPSSGGGTGNTPYSLQIFIGPNCGNFTNTGDTNIGIGGYDAENETVTTFGSLTTGIENVAIGFGALGSLTSGYGNTCVGEANGENITTGSDNTSVGRNNLGTVTGSNNTTMGSGLFGTLTSGSDNVGVGQNIGQGLSGADSFNTIVGSQSFYNVGTGSNNTMLGGQCGVGLPNLSINFSGCVMVGYYAGHYATSNNEFFLNNQDRTNYAGDQTKSLLYGTFASTAAAQNLTCNATFQISVDRGFQVTNQTSGAGAQAGTITNAPTAGNPGFWLKIKIGGVSYSLPAWAG